MGAVMGAATGVVIGVVTGANDVVKVFGDAKKVAVALAWAVGSY